MIAPGADLKIYMATRPVDFRRGLDGLAAAAQENQVGAAVLLLEALPNTVQRSQIPGTRICVDPEIVGDACS